MNFGQEALLTEVLRAGDQRIRVERAAVCVLRREVGDDLAPVDPAPTETRMGEIVELIPRDLLREEVGHSRLAQDLGQRGRVSEDIGKPQVVRNDAELVAEEVLAMENLPHERLSGCEVAVGLDPHAALNLPATLRYRLLHALIQFGISHLDKGVVLRLRRPEHVLRILPHECELGRKGAGALADRLGHRPEPGGVDMRVPHGGHAHLRRSRGPMQFHIKPIAARRQILPSPGIDIDRFARRPEQPGPPRALLRQSPQQSEDKPQIQPERP